MSATDTAPVGFFRCQIQGEQAAAKIRCGKKSFRASVQETSIDGFTVQVGPQVARSLKVGNPWILSHLGNVIEVHPQWFNNDEDGKVAIGLRRLRDLTPPEHSRRSLLVSFGGAKFADPSLMALMYGGFVIALFTTLALPGVGDRLGTSSRIQNAMEWVGGEVKQAVKSF